MKKIISLAIFVLITLYVSAQQKPVAFKGALIYPVTGTAIQNGILVIQKGKIISIGGPETAIPSDAEIKDVTGKIIMPGLIDTHSHLGGPDGGDASSAL